MTDASEKDLQERYEEAASALAKSVDRRLPVEYYMDSEGVHVVPKPSNMPEKTGIGSNLLNSLFGKLHD